MNSSNNGHLVPFLRWAGGKQQLAAKLAEFVPKDIKGTYYEPFLGAGSLFFRIQPKRSFLSDANPHLISTYQHIKENANLVAQYAARHRNLNSEAYYYSLRDEYNSSSPSAAQAARFVYLNKACFNGIFRVNRKGLFNVPYGRKEPPAVPGHSELAKISRALANSVLASLTFKQALLLPVKGDFVYLDPPYPPLSDTAYFTHYTQDLFSDSDQRRLAGFVHELDRRGVSVLISNADTKLVRELYEGMKIKRVDVTRYITCKKKRHRVRELVISNFSTVKTTHDK